MSKFISKTRANQRRAGRYPEDRSDQRVQVAEAKADRDRWSSGISVVERPDVIAIVSRMSPLSVPEPVAKPTTVSVLAGSRQ
ncbi:hypothetical protein CCR82_01955 [Halochromatium salexigens]|uniref:Uncharacterized protein n=1 Tax=Halochromatium salexigens TaxID=49447 RepID=A0AAJ0UD72_HALSE|nr:hypothetical protein [Halochromatium salexigens]